ncbi:Pentatricopeptide repeat-containing protein At2g27800, mitochondrial, partial [Linum perenne]
YFSSSRQQLSNLSPPADHFNSSIKTLGFRSTPPATSETTEQAKLLASFLFLSSFPVYAKVLDRMVSVRLKSLIFISSATNHTSLFPLLRRPIAPSISRLRRSYSNRPPSNSPARRASRRLRDSQKPVLDESKFQAILDRIPPRFTNEELFNVLTMEEDPLICLELFNWASHQPRFKHDSSTYHATIKKLGVAKMYEEMDEIISQVLAVPAIGNEALFNTIVYFLAEARKLTRAVKVFQHMRKSRKSDSRPSIRTYNILFTAMLSRGKNSYVNHMYMDTISSLFKLMVNDGIDPDIYSLNSMIKGWVWFTGACRILSRMII